MRRAVAIIRVSQQGDREGDGFTSPRTQQQQVRRLCEREGFELAETFPEIDVSGGRALNDRPGLLAAVEMVEAGDADAVVTAYFDRFARNLVSQREALERIEAAGGELWTGDAGRISHATAAQKQHANMLGVSSEYVRDSIRERTAAATQDALDRGLLVRPWLPFWLERGSDGHGVVIAERVPIAREMFTRRAAGESYETIRVWLRGHGIVLSRTAVRNALKDRLAIGQQHYGTFKPNLSCVDPIVDPTLWRSAQSNRSRPGRHPVVPSLLGRLGVLRCSGCGGRMVQATGKSGAHRIYRCATATDCPRRVAISMDVADRVVVAAVLEQVAGMTGTASTEDHVRELEEERDALRVRLNDTIAVFAEQGLAQDPAAVQALAKLRREHERAVASVDQARARSAVVTVSVDDWEDRSLEARREIVRAVVERAVVLPGRGADRVRVELSVA
jgi:DNA invertase Pin-like site-specific DNA recombinase